MYNVCVSCANELSSGNTLPGTYAMLNSARLSAFFRGTQEELVAARGQARRPRFARIGGRAPRAALQLCRHILAFVWKNCLYRLYNVCIDCIAPLRRPLMKARCESTRLRTL